MVRELIFYDPATTFAVLVGVTAGAQLLSGIAEGNLAKEVSEAEASFIEAEGIQIQKQRDRDTQDLKRERARTLSRSRAVLAASGADTAAGSPLAVLKSQAASFGRRQARLEDDANVAFAANEARRNATLATGRIQRDVAIFGGVTRAIGTSATLLRPAPAPRTTTSSITLNARRNAQF